MQCPICNVDLMIADRQSIEIDYCPKCRGVWLDRGELDKIIERSASPPPAPRPQEYRDYQHHHGSYQDHPGYYKPRHKRKSFLEEVFDFD